METSLCTATGNHVQFCHDDYNSAEGIRALLGANLIRENHVMQCDVAVRVTDTEVSTIVSNFFDENRVVFPVLFGAIGPVIGTTQLNLAVSPFSNQVN